MDSAEVVHRLQFAITATFHYLFPQLTMGLALLLVVFQTLAWRTRQERYARAARFWLRIFAINFAIGVVTGIPLEFQFGTNWSRFSEKSGGVIGQTLAMEGMFAFFLESSFLGLLLFGGKRLSERGRWIVTTLLWFGTWLSGYFIVTTNAWMQHPVGYGIDANGRLQLESLGALLLNPWAFWQYVHTMLGAVMTGAFVMAGVGAFYLLGRRHEPQARLYVRTGVLAGLCAALLLAFPTGDLQAQNVLKHQPVTLAAMEGLFETRSDAPLVLVGQPDMEKKRLDNALELPGVLSFITYRRWDAEVKGLDAFPEEDWPQNIPLLYYAYHVMVGLGTLLLLLAAAAAWRLRGGRLFASRPLLWLLVLAIPFPYIANTMGWMTAELGRQPWVIWGVQRTADAYSSEVSAGNALFTLIGFCGIYLVLGILFLALVFRRLAAGPEPEPGETPPAPPASHPGPA
jgi:cytochrome d ubiquinol oxidase subunit I